MNIIEALELLKQGYAIKDIGSNFIYKMYSDGRIYHAIKDTYCASRIITSSSEHDWMYMGNHKFKIL